MGLLNHLFGSEKSIARELVKDDARRIKLWEQHIANFAERERLSKHFNYRNVDQALADFETTLTILRKIEHLISPELVTITDEEKTDQEILDDLQRLRNNDEIEQLTGIVSLVKQKESSLLELFQEIYKVLCTELHLIRAIQNKPPNTKELLIKLFRLIFHQEARLYSIFLQEFYYDENKHIHQYVTRISHAIILESEIKEEMETDAEKFAREMFHHISNPESRHHYRKLGEDIFLALAERAGAPMPRVEDIMNGIENMEREMRDDDLMYRIVKKLRPKYDDSKIHGVIIAFRRAYTLLHFEELASEFVT